MFHPGMKTLQVVSEQTTMDDAVPKRNILVSKFRDTCMLVRNDNLIWSNTKTKNFRILIDKCCGMYFINFSFPISREENVQVVRMKPADLQWTCKTTSVLPQRQMEKVLDQWKKVTWQGHFILSRPCGILSINMKPQNLWFKLCLLISIIENN